MWFYLNENKSSKTMLETLCSLAISALPKIHPLDIELITRGKKYNYPTSNKLTKYQPMPSKTIYSP